MNHDPRYTPGKWEDWDAYTFTRPAHDCILIQPCELGSNDCTPGSGGSHGRGTVRMWWLLRKDDLAVQFLLFTGWCRPETEEFYDQEPPDRGYGGRWWNPYKAMAADLGYHSDTPSYEGQGEMDCDVLPGRASCFYDGSGLNAEEPWRVLREKGQDGLWEYLAGYWRECDSGRHEQADS